MKTKGQQPLAAEQEPLALCDFRGGLAERSNASDCKSVDGDFTAVQGSESLTRRRIDSTPAEARTSTGARTAQPKPYRSVNLSIRLLAVERNDHIKPKTGMWVSREQRTTGLPSTTGSRGVGTG